MTTYINPVDGEYVLNDSYIVSSSSRLIATRLIQELAHVKTVSGFDFDYFVGDLFQVPVMTAGMNAIQITIPSTTDLSLYLNTNTTIKNDLRAGYSDAILLDVTGGAFAGEYLIVNTTLQAGFHGGSTGDLVISLTNSTNQADFNVLNFTTVAYGTVLTLSDALAYNESGVLPAPGAYSITDTASTIVSAIADITSSTVLGDAKVITATGVASAAQANALHGFIDPIIYSLADTASNLVSADEGVIGARTKGDCISIYRIGGVVYQSVVGGTI